MMSVDDPYDERPYDERPVVEEKPPKPPPPPREPGVGPPFQAKDWVAIIIAIGASMSILCVCIAVMWDAIGQGAEVSENGTQIITGVLGGMIGVLGGYLGYSAAIRRNDPPKPPDPPPP